MAKRRTGVGKGKKTPQHKTAKRLEIKRLMLIRKMNQHRKHNRRISPGKLKSKN